MPPPLSRGLVLCRRAIGTFWLRSMLVLSVCTQHGTAPPTPPAAAAAAPFPAIITVKTTAQNHASRVAFSLSSWLSLAPPPNPARTSADYDYKSALAAVVFVTDVDMASEHSRWTQNSSGVDRAGVGRLLELVDAASLPRRFVDSGCILDRRAGDQPPAEGTAEMNRHLVCKTIAEMKVAEQRLQEQPGASWWCHFDDDQLVLLRSLAILLEQNERGEPPVSHSAATAMDINSQHIASGNWLPLPRSVGLLLGRIVDGRHHKHVTGGAGYCMDRHSVPGIRQQMEAWVAQHPAVPPDDVLLGKVWTESFGDDSIRNFYAFHSQYDSHDVIAAYSPRDNARTNIPLDILAAQVSFGGQQRELMRVQCLLHPAECAMTRAQCFAMNTPAMNCKLPSPQPARSGYEQHRDRRAEGRPRATGLQLEPQHLRF